MRADSELFAPAAVLAALRLEAGCAGDVSVDVAMRVMDEFYDCLDSYSRDKESREPYRITQTLDDVKYDV